MAVLVLLEELLYLGLDSLLQHLLSTPANQLIERVAPFELLRKLATSRST